MIFQGSLHVRELGYSFSRAFKLNVDTDYL